jgi:hypothetical protein
MHIHAVSSLRVVGDEPVRLFSVKVALLQRLARACVRCRSHGEYPILYDVWALCLPEAWAHAACFGIAVHFVLSTGIAKLSVGGLSWMRCDSKSRHARIHGSKLVIRPVCRPETMRTYLDCYRGSKSAPPFSKQANAWLSGSDTRTTALAVGTVLLECVLVPSSLFLPPNARPLLAAMLIMMHIGIAVTMSTRVGLIFITSLPAYTIGFSCNAPVASGTWMVASVIGLVPSATAALCGRKLPENWPSSPISLFMFSAPQVINVIH